VATFQKGKASPNAAVFIFAILISSVLFAIGHLPIAYLLFPDHTIALTTFVIIGNSMFGLVAGYLYWKKGLESAMIAHAFHPSDSFFGELLWRVFLREIL
jgi:membrane protease YdiL (CAAX protease family)